MNNQTEHRTRTNTLTALLAVVLVMVSVVAVMIVGYYMPDRFSSWSLLSVLFVLLSFVALTAMLHRQGERSEVKYMQSVLLFKTVKFCVAIAWIVTYVVAVKVHILSFAIMFMSMYVVSTVLETLIVLNRQKERKASALGAAKTKEEKKEQ